VTVDDRRDGFGEVDRQMAPHDPILASGATGDPYSPGVSTIDVRPLTSADVRPAARVLARAFDDSPIMRYLVPRDRVRALGTATFFRATLRDALAYGETWVTTVDRDLVGAAVWLPPGAYPQGTRRQLAQLLRLLAVAPIAPLALVRSLRYVQRVEAAHPGGPHWYLETLGVDPSHQGRGLGTRLLDVVLPRVDETGAAVYLETDKERNLAYYARHRFAETGRLEPVPGGPPTWTMWREPA
jgi:GNAT superfamily N-acetyltransferase